MKKIRLHAIANFYSRKLRELVDRVNSLEADFNGTMENGGRVCYRAFRVCAAKLRSELQTVNDRHIAVCNALGFERVTAVNERYAIAVEKLSFFLD